jgi:hypothetical protein
MDNRDCLAHYPFIRIACRCLRAPLRLMRLAAQHRPYDVTSTVIDINRSGVVGDAAVSEYCQSDQGPHALGTVGVDTPYSSIQKEVLAESPVADAASTVAPVTVAGSQ